MRRSTSRKVGRGGHQRSRALTLIDVMITTMVLGIVVAASVPLVMANERTILVSAARQLAADIEYAQVRSITQSAQPTLLVVQDDGSGYHLADDASPASAISLPQGAVGAGDPYAVHFGGYRAQTLAGVTLRVVQGGTMHPGESVTSLQFDQYGRLNTAEDALLELEFAHATTRIRVVTLTGTVRFE